MDKESVKKWIGKHAKPLMRRLGIPHWRIEFEYKFSEDAEWGGQCYAQPDYESALIKLNCPKIADEKELSQVVTHELLHTMACPFQNYRDAVAEAVSKDVYALLDTVYLSASERTVKNLERMKEAG